MFFKRQKVTFNFWIGILLYSVCLYGLFVFIHKYNLKEGFGRSKTIIKVYPPKFDKEIATSQINVNGRLATVTTTPMKMDQTTNTMTTGANIVFDDEKGKTYPINQIAYSDPKSDPTDKTKNYEKITFDTSIFTK